MGGSYYSFPYSILSIGKDRKTPQRYPDVPTTSWRIYIRSMDSATLNGGQNYKARILLVVDTHRRDAPLVIQECKKCKEQSAIGKAAKNGAIATGNGWSGIRRGSCRFGVPRTIRLEKMKSILRGIFKNLCKGLKLTQSFSPVTKHMEIMNHIEKQLTRRQQGWVDDLAQVLWVHRTLPRNSQKETPFSLTYGSEAIIPIAENAVAKDDKGRTNEVTKKKEGKEVA
ncbi:reverse transcriptase domain-containing protein [Tanacetum coccineum]